MTDLNAKSALSEYEQLASDYEQLAVVLPVDLTLFGIVTDAIGTLWPDAKLHAAKKGRVATATFLIPKGSAHGTRPLTDEQAAAIHERTVNADDAEQGQLLAFDESGFTMNAPDALMLALAELCIPILKSAPEANYMHVTVQNENGEPFEVVVQRASKPTPHAKRLDAEARLAEVEGLLRKAGDMSNSSDVKALVSEYFNRDPQVNIDSTPDDAADGS